MTYSPLKTWRGGYRSGRTQSATGYGGLGPRASGRRTGHERHHTDARTDGLCGGWPLTPIHRPWPLIASSASPPIFLVCPPWRTSEGGRRA